MTQKQLDALLKHLDIRFDIAIERAFGRDPWHLWEAQEETLKELKKSFGLAEENDDERS